MIIVGFSFLGFPVLVDGMQDGVYGYRLAFSFIDRVCMQRPTPARPETYSKKLSIKNRVPEIARLDS